MIFKELYKLIEYSHVNIIEHFGANNFNVYSYSYKEQIPGNFKNREVLMVRAFSDKGLGVLEVHLEKR